MVWPSYLELLYHLSQFLYLNFLYHFVFTIFFVRNYLWWCIVFSLSTFFLIWNNSLTNIQCVPDACNYIENSETLRDIILVNWEKVGLFQVKTRHSDTVSKFKISARVVKIWRKIKLVFFFCKIEISLPYSKQIWLNFAVLY